MWYFSWILGLGLALTFGVLNAMWYEIRTQPGTQEREGAAGAAGQSPAAAAEGPAAAGERPARSASSGSQGIE